MGSVRPYVDKDNLSKELSEAELELSKKEPELQALDESFSKLEGAMSPDFLVEKIFLDVSNLTVSLEETTRDFSTKTESDIQEIHSFAIEIKNKFLAISKIINNKTFNFTKESKENGELYGSIKPKEITNLIKEKVNAEVNPSQIILKDELNKIGIFKVEVNFHTEVKANISIKIDKIQSK